VLADAFPNRLAPSRGPYNAQQVAELAKLCRVGVINPIAWTKLLGEPRLMRVAGGESHGLIPGVPIRHPLHWYVPVAGRWRYGPTLTRCIRRACRRMRGGKWDVVYATWAHPHGYAAMRLAEEWEVPCVIKVRGTDINVLSEDHGRRRRTAHVLSRADAVIAVSGDLSAKVAALGAERDRIHVLHNGVDTERFHPISGDEARRRLRLDRAARWIVFIGNLVPVKGLDLLLAALARLGNQAIRAALVGSGPSRRRLERQARSVGVSERVTFAGERPHEEIPLWLNAADVTCLPSRNEGCPNVVLESLACGRPVVASRVGAVPDLVGPDSGIVVEPDDAAALAHGLRSALERQWNHETIRSTVLDRSWRRNAQRLLEIMEQCIGARGRPRDR